MTVCCFYVCFDKWWTSGVIYHCMWRINMKVLDNMNISQVSWWPVACSGQFTPWLVPYALWEIWNTDNHIPCMKHNQGTISVSLSLQVFEQMVVIYVYFNIWDFFTQYGYVQSMFIVYMYILFVWIIPKQSSFVKQKSIAFVQAKPRSKQQQQ